MKINLDEIKISRLTDRDLYSVDNLIESIKEVGLVEPIVINEKKEVLVGRRRYLACKKLKLNEVECVYYDRSKIDSDIAIIDSNLLFLPLNSVDYDHALSRRKALFLQKYPETRQYGANVPGQNSFTKEVSTFMGINKRTIERAICRAEKATHKVNQARRDDRLTPGIVDALVRLPPTYQDTLLPEIEGKSVSQVKRIVEMAFKRDIQSAVNEARKKDKVFTLLESLENDLEKINDSAQRCLRVKYKYSEEMIRIMGLARDTIDMLDKFVKNNTPYSPPILRKSNQLVTNMN